MSDWEIVGNIDNSRNKTAFDWEMVKSKPEQSESLIASIAKSPFRIGEDVLGGAMNFLKQAPSYYQQAKTEIPGLVDVLRQHPRHAGLQAIAGAEELANKLSHLPLNLASYGSQRLHLIPESVPEQINKFTPRDLTEHIAQTFGEPKYPGEALIRGSIRNLPEAIGATKLASIANPLKYSAKNISKDILKEELKQIKSHSKQYDSLWNEAEASGFNNVPYDKSLLGKNSKLIQKFYPEKSTMTLRDFMSNPTLQNAQKAQSDLGNLRRQLEEKSRTTPLLGSEKYLHDALDSAEKHIESNMFKNNSGKVNEPLRNKYKTITNSYRENVVPYKYNKDIQAFKNKELLAEELRKRLSKGEFAAKKGSKHPELFLTKKLKKALGIGGVIGGILGGDKISNYLEKD